MLLENGVSIIIYPQKNLKLKILVMKIGSRYKFKSYIQLYKP